MLFNVPSSPKDVRIFFKRKIYRHFRRRNFKFYDSTEPEQNNELEILIFQILPPFRITLQLPLSPNKIFPIGLNKKNH